MFRLLCWFETFFTINEHQTLPVLRPFKFRIMRLCSLLISLFFAPTIAWIPASPLGLQSLNQGNSMAVEEENQFLVSPDGTFSSGFYPVGNNAYCFSTWFTNSLNKTVVWTANRDKPLNGKRSRLTLNTNGNLILTDADGSVAWSTGTSTNEQIQVQLRETGNLILVNLTGKIIWQSFDFPTDTLLPFQKFNKESTLVSVRSQGTYSSGFYYFKFNDDNVLNLIYNDPAISSVYWPNSAFSVFSNGRTRYNSSRIAILNDVGGFQSSDRVNFDAVDYGLGPKRRMTLDYDGMLRLYSLDESSGDWKIMWFPGDLDACSVHGMCGEYGVCTYDPFPTCTCPDGFTRNNLSDWTKGCKPSFHLTCNLEESDFIELSNTDYFGYDLNYRKTIPIAECRNSCLSDCNCKGFGYSLDGEGRCYTKGILLNGQRKADTYVVTHIKVSKRLTSSRVDVQKEKYNYLKCPPLETVLNANVTMEMANKSRHMRLLAGFVVTIGIIELISVGFGWWNVFRKDIQEEFANMGYIALAMGFKRYTYAELKKATKNFKHVIGKGGFGVVYKGVLDDGRLIAVKRLEGILQGDDEFWAEVSTIGKINHRNLVKLWGFCVEKHQKMLVYEYVKNGSLDKLLFSESYEGLGFDQRCGIAVGTAKGLLYLHEECLEWVLHCDIKPQNILLDEELNPKVADFGMSKLFRDVNETGFSKVRGTRGYLAPEWMLNQKIDAKADVYSYGVVLLELLSGKNASSFQFTNGSLTNRSIDLVKWMSRNIEEEGIERVIDPRMKGKCSVEKVEKMIKVALLCVEDDRNMRPSMSKVVELLSIDCNESS